MKILYIITSGDIGGAQKYVLELADYFRGTIAVGGEHAELLNEARQRQIPTIKLRYMKRAINPIYDILAFFELISVVRKSGVEIVHTNSTKAGILGSIAGKLCGKKTVFTVHGLSLMDNGTPAGQLIYKYLEKFTSFFRDKIITVSDYDKSLVLSNNIASPQKVITIYNGLPAIEFLDKKQARQELDIELSSLIIGTIARLQYLKGIDLLIQAIALLPKALLNKCLVIVIGDGPDRKILHDLIIKLKLQSHIYLLGSKANAARYLKAFDIFVMPSRYEGFPFGLIEAMQSEISIIYTKVGGLKEVIGDTGMIVPPNSSEAIAQSIAGLIQNQGLQQNLASQARNRSQRFTLQQTLIQTERVYLAL